ncbi:MAG: hypothetical protein UU80_C0001G0034 [candidate division WWE3 bacterium GW2011_GWA1_41_8]|uniref:Uncharacterized protein n=2 Tax=Katanobacteria TaxID=422282 RepID=A0A0G0XD54_UNCKA|nr:MAG: hypothetical protein UU72_C0001G0080 [candidate division WWE3 bacterium GW2011_GWB1_41_6]KKS22869.1 MAG: hypothetical protein UU80_C0001G0034 [candidate division WWE3 bacterium GW2011_GWA1_41_8]
MEKHTFFLLLFLLYPRCYNYFMPGSTSPEGSIDSIVDFNEQAVQNEHSEREALWSGIPVEDIKKIKAQTEISISREKAPELVKIIKNRAIQEVNRTWESETAEGIKVIENYWAFRNDMNNPELDIQYHETLITKVTDSRGLDIFNEELQKLAEKYQMPIVTKDDAIKVYTIASNAELSDKFHGEYQRIENTNVTELYSVEELELIAHACQEEQRLREHVHRLSKHAENGAIEWFKSKDMEPPVDLSVFVDNLCSRVNFYGIEEEPFIKEIGEQSIYLLLDQEKTSLGDFKEYLDVTIPRSKRFLGLEDYDPDPRFENFDKSEEERLGNLIEVIVPVEMRQRLEKIVKSSAREMGVLSIGRISQKFTDGQLDVGSIWGSYRPSNGTFMFMAGNVGEKFSPEEVYGCIHEVAHGEILSFLSYPELMAEYLSVLPYESDALTQYVQMLGSDNKEKELLDRYSERFSELFSLLLMDPDKLENDSPKMYEWAVKYYKVRFGEDRDPVEDSMKRWEYIFAVNEGVPPTVAKKAIQHPSEINAEELEGFEKKLLGLEEEIKYILKLRKNIPSEEWEIVSDQYMRWVKFAHFTARVKSYQTSVEGKVEFEIPISTLDASGKATGETEPWVLSKWGKRQIFRSTGNVLSASNLSQDRKVQTALFSTMLSPYTTFVEEKFYETPYPEQNVHGFGPDFTQIKYKLKVTFPSYVNKDELTASNLYSYAENGDIVI